MVDTSIEILGISTYLKMGHKAAESADNCFGLMAKKLNSKKLLQ